MSETPRDEDLPFFLRPAGLMVFVGLLAALKLFVAANTHLVEDEAYYRLWGLFPAWSYYDHPPMIGWWIAAGQTLFGDTVFAVRAMVVFTGLLGIAALWRTAKILFDARTAGWAVLFLGSSLLVGIGGMLATPDAPSVLFWGLAFWALAELVHSRNANWWLVVGLMAGLGLVSKYSVLFFGAGIVLWLLWVPEARRWFASWQLWVGGLIAIACFAPVLLWNHAHEWVSFYKQFGRAGSKAFTSKYIFEFLGALVGLLNPLIAVLAALGAAQIFRRFLTRDMTASLIILTVLPFTAYLVYHSLHSRVQGNWPAPLFPVFALMAAAFVSGLPDTGGRIWKRVAQTAVAVGVLLAVVVQAHAVWPLTGQFARKDPTFQLRGWTDIGRQIKTLSDTHQAGYILTSGYGLNGQLDFLMKDSLPVHQFTERVRYLMMPDPDGALFAETGLYITEKRRDQSHALTSLFADVEEVATLQRRVKGVFLEDLIVYKIDGVNAPVLQKVTYK